MPAKHTSSLRSQLKDTSSYAMRVYEQLSRTIAIQNKVPGYVAARVIYSQPPWNAAVAFSLLDLHQLARETEAVFRRYASQPVRPRGGSDKNTRLALEAVNRLSDAVPDIVVEEADRDLNSWIRKSRVVLGELELPQRLPRLPGQNEPACPFCNRRSLRMFPLKGAIVCILPLCKDEDGRKPVARMEFSKFTQNWELVWQDSVVGIPA